MADTTGTHTQPERLSEVDPGYTPEPGRPKRWRPSVNISRSERVGRIVIGLLATVGGLVLLSSAGSALAIGLTSLLALAGLDLVVTGSLGHCPLYQKLGHVPASLRR